MRPIKSTIMNTKRIVAYLILLASFLLPFRFAYLDLPDTGAKSLVYFLFVVLGVAIYTVIMFGVESKEERGE